MIPGDERLTEIDTHNCYICKVAQYLVSHEALLRATYALVHEGFVNLPSLLYHPYLVCIPFGMPPLHPFTFLMFFKSCFCTFLMLISVTKPNLSKLVNYGIDNLIVVPSM